MTQDKLDRAAYGDDRSHRHTTIVLVAAEPFLRAGVRAVLDQSGWCHLLAETEHTDTALRLVADLQPDTVLIDAALPTGDPTALAADLATLAPAPAILVCSLACSSRPAASLAQIGVRGFICAGAEPIELINALRAVRDGGIYLSGKLAPFLLAPALETEIVDRFGLTARETEILGLLADGLTNREAAEYLQLSVRTVETHRYNIRQKTQARSLSDLVTIARKLNRRATDGGRERGSGSGSGSFVENDDRPIEGAN